MYLNDLFYAVENADICNFTDDTTPHYSSNDMNEAMINIEHDCTTLLVEWLRVNSMTLNASNAMYLLRVIKMG